MKKKLMNMRNARFSEQKSKMEEIQKHGVCPFCPKYFSKYHDAPIIKETSNWLLTKNDYPYDGSRVHLLLIHKKHVENITEISSEAAGEMFQLVNWAAKTFKIKGGGLSMRFGDVHYNAATITHIHAHILTGYKEGRNREKLSVQLGFKK